MPDNRIFYTDLIVSCIKVTKVEGTNTCTFEAKDDTTNPDGAVFLKNIRLTEDSPDTYENRKFLADIVSSQEATKYIDERTASGKGKPLFCIHGFNNEPGYAFDGYRPSDTEEESMTGSYNQARGRFAELSQADKPLGYYPVPVVWPTSGDYANDTILAKQSGDALKVLLDHVEGAVREKALLCHSMGNKVLCNAVQNGITCNFDNIFLVAADVDWDIFNHTPKTSNWMTADEKEKVGKNIFSMLSTDSNGNPKGKVYVCQSKYDLAMIGSSWRYNWFSRLGGYGVKKRSGWVFWSDDESTMVEKFRPYIDNFDCAPFAKECEDKKKHSYQFEKWAINFYESKYV